MLNQIREAGSQQSYVTFIDLSNFITRFSDFVRKSVGRANPDLFQFSVSLHQILIVLVMYGISAKIRWNGFRCSQIFKLHNSFIWQIRSKSANMSLHGPSQEKFWRTAMIRRIDTRKTPFYIVDEKSLGLNAYHLEIGNQKSVVLLFD